MEFFTRIRFIFFALLIVAAGCSDDSSSGSQPTEEEFLVGSEFVYTTTAQQLQLLAQLSGLNVNPSNFIYDIEIYKVTYNTHYGNMPLVASGLVTIPKTDQPIGMLSFQHGTITKYDDAPSNFTAGDYNTVSFAAMASVGLIGVIPDYLGFGTSESILHPYYVEEPTASSVIDLLKAASEFAAEKGLNFNRELFLAGYSEGGYSTMAAHKSIEENGLDDFTLIASFPAAGAYDLKGVQEAILPPKSMPIPIMSLISPEHTSYIMKKMICCQIFLMSLMRPESPDYLMAKRELGTLTRSSQWLYRI